MVDIVDTPAAIVINAGGNVFHQISKNSNGKKTRPIILRFELLYSNIFSEE
jgi:hypothetical protein